MKETDGVEAATAKAIRPGAGTSSRQPAGALIGAGIINFAYCPLLSFYREAKVAANREYVRLCPREYRALALMDFDRQQAEQEKTPPASSKTRTNWYLFFSVIRVPTGTGSETIAYFNEEQRKFYQPYAPAGSA